MMTLFIDASLTMTITDISQSEEIFTVTRLNREVRFLLEGTFPPLWIEGELSNFVAPQSGHWYFSLKDETAQVRCAMFKPQNRRLTITPKDGMQVLIKAKISLYEGRGDFQLLVEHMEEAGVGKLQKAFEALKKRLAAAGLFDAAHKKPLPAIPTCIGVITSPTGAAIKDILHVLKRRFSSAPVIIYPTLVQGELAAANIVAAIQNANQRKECDALILARGGGSIEDLWPFNEEIVAHAIFKSNIPIISGVGHEIDFTIADFVADMRAPTPTAAAELLTPDKQALLSHLSRSKNQLLQLMKQSLNPSQQQLTWLNKQLQQQHPKRRLREQAQQLDQHELTLTRLIYHSMTTKRTSLNTLHAALLARTPQHTIRDHRHHLRMTAHQLQNLMQKSLLSLRHSFIQLATQLDTLSPLATLKRGYAIATRQNHTVIASSDQVEVGDKIDVRLAMGRLVCKVEKKDSL